MSLLDILKEVVGSATSDGVGALTGADLMPIFRLLLEDSANHDQHEDAQRWLKSSMNEWVERERLDEFARELNHEVRRVFADLSGTELARVLQSAAVMALGEALEPVCMPLSLAPGDLGRGRLLVLREAGRTAVQASHGAYSRKSDARRFPRRYAEEIGLIEGGATTSAGRVFLRLRGREAVRWLLALELERSAGWEDPWRLGRDSARQLLRQPSLRWDELYGLDTGPPCHWQTFLRLCEFGVLSRWDVPDVHDGYDLTEAGRDILEELTATERSPLVSLAAGLASDLTANALEAAGQMGREAARATVEEATSQQARILAHELRNKLVPVKEALEIVFRQLTPEQRVGRADKALSLGRQAIADTFQFIDATAHLAEGLNRPQEWFGLGQALDDAVRLGRNGRTDAVVTVSALLRDFDLHANRERFVFAIANLVRNAIQSASDRPTVQFELEAGTDSYSLLVDDAGPGVAPAELDRIFEPGYTGRPGGTGLGLEIVRQTVERDLLGAITCEKSPLGGARFRISVPTRRLKPRTDGPEKGR